MIKNGPKGIGSFLVFMPDISKVIEIIAPIKKDSNVQTSKSLHPNINPKTVIRVTSPPPMPPRDTNTMSRKTISPSNAPNIPSFKFMVSAYKK